MQNDVFLLALKPALTQSAGAESGRFNPVTALLLAGHRTMLQIECRAGTATQIFPPVEAGKKSTARRHHEVPPPARWGINE